MGHDPKERENAGGAKGTVRHDAKERASMTLKSAGYDERETAVGVIEESSELFLQKVCFGSFYIISIKNISWLWFEWSYGEFSPN